MTSRSRNRPANACRLVFSVLTKSKWRNVQQAGNVTAA
jgi:hypothetical protein